MATVNERAVSILTDHMKKATKTTKRTAAVAPHAPDDRVAAFTLSYLDAFGYLEEELGDWKDISLGDIITGIKKFQSFFGLKGGGEVTVKTVRAMQIPRCGVPDVVQPWQPYAQVRQFVRANLARWQKDSLRFAIADVPAGLDKTAYGVAVRDAFQAWWRNGNIVVTIAGPNQRPDIVVSVGKGPQSNFDGPGGTLAWAYLPNGQDGQLSMKMDADEDWTLQRGGRGIYAPAVLCHEFGHTFGLDHSRKQAALMAPIYNPQVVDPQQDDDIPRFVARYGARTTPVDPPVDPAHPPAGGTTTIDVTSGNNLVAINLDGRKVA